MSTEPQVQHHGDEDTETLTLEDLAEQVQALKKNQKGLRVTLGKERDQREALEDQVTALQEENEELQEIVDTLDERTNLLEMVEMSDKMEGKQRSTALLQHLHRKATAKANTPDKASLDREGAAEALHYPDIDRTTYYDDMQRCERLVGNKKVCRYSNGKLRVNLEVGDLPAGLRSTRSTEGE